MIQTFVNIYKSNGEAISSSTLTTVAVLEKKTKELLYKYHSGLDFEIILGIGNIHLNAFIYKISGRSTSEKIEEISFVYLLKNILRIHEASDEIDIMKIQQYKDLITFLYSSLKEIRVYCVGSEDFDIFISGITPAGDHIILKARTANVNA